MTRRTVTVGTQSITIADDDPINRAGLQWALLRTRAIDELTGEPPHAQLRVDCDVPGTRPRVANGGLCGVVGRPIDVARALATERQFSATIRAAGFLARDLTWAIDHARRSLTVGAVPLDTDLTVTPNDPVPAAPAVRQQFAAGRGVFIERGVSTEPDEFTLTDARAPLANDSVPLLETVQRAHAAPTTQVAGVPIALPDQPLHRARPLALRGRVRRRLPVMPPQFVPAPAAQIGIRGYWASYPAATSSAPLAPDFCAIDPPLYLDHDAGATVEGCAITLVGPNGTLEQTAEPGSDEIVISANVASTLIPGDLIGIDDPARAEHEVVMFADFVPPVDLSVPSRIRLHTPTAVLHRAQVQVRAASAGAFVPAGATTRESQAGDATLFASNLAALATQGWLIVARATRPDVHRFRQIPQSPNNATFLHPVAIDADGRFEWPAVARVAQLRIAVVHAGHAPLILDFALDYDGDNPLAVVLI
jgi:hypothetical protein